MITPGRTVRSAARMAAAVALLAIAVPCSAQLNDPFATVMGGEWSACIVRVIGYTEGTGTFAYASVVDNATDDAFFVRGVKRMRPTD